MNGYTPTVDDTKLPPPGAEKPKRNEVYMNDESLMPFGKYKGTKLANVPAWYLLSLYDNNRCYGQLKEYIIDNLDILRNEK